MVAYTCYLHDARVRREAGTLARHGCEVDCLCLRAEGKPKCEQINGIRLYRLPLSKYRGSSRLMYALAYLWFFILSFFAVARLHLKKRYDVIQYHTLPDFIILSGIIPKLSGAKLILDMHEVTPEFYSSKFHFRMSHPIVMVLKLLERISVSFAHAVIVINDPIKRLLLERCRSRSDITVVMNTADEVLFGSGPSQRSKRKNGFVAMYHGTLTHLYGVDIAIRAVARLKGEIPGLEFRIFGSESETERFKNLVDELGVSNVVVFMGRVEMDTVAKHIDETDIGIVPTIRDGYIDLSFSNKLAEYVSRKAPVVATRLNSTLEYFTEDAVSYFESGDVDDLASKILQLYRDPRKRLLQAEMAFQQYQAIRWAVMEKRYVELIESLVA